MQLIQKNDDDMKIVCYTVRHWNISNVLLLRRVNIVKKAIPVLIALVLIVIIGVALAGSMVFDKTAKNNQRGIPGFNLFTFYQICTDLFTD